MMATIYTKKINNLVKKNFSFIAKYLTTQKFESRNKALSERKCALIFKKKNLEYHTYPSSVNFQNINFLFKRFVSNSKNVQNLAVPEEIQNGRCVSDVPGFKKYPVIGSLIDILKIKDFFPNRVYYFWMYMTNKYGPIFQVTFPGLSTFIAVTEPDDLETIYRSTMTTSVRPGFLDPLKKIRYENNYFEKKGGILVENSEEWKRVRSEIQTPMMKPKNIFKYAPAMDQVALKFVERISTFQKTHGQMPDNFLNEMYKWALESVSLVAVNRRLETLEENLTDDSTQMQLLDAINKFLVHMGQAEMGLQTWRFTPYSPLLNKMKKIHKIIFDILDDYVKESEKQWAERVQMEDDEIPLLQVLLQRPNLTRKDVMTFIMDMFTAGIDTTSSSLGFTLYLLAKNKAAQERLHKELDEVLGDGCEKIDKQKLAKLSFTKQCVKEGLRIFPIAAGTHRLLDRDLTIHGYNIPKNSLIFLLFGYPMQSEKYFKRAKEFLPERWGRDQPLGPIHPFASLPFSHGIRMCIGRRIAEQEMYILLARIMHRYKIDYRGKDIEIVSKFISVPSQPLNFIFSERCV